MGNHQDASVAAVDLRMVSNADCGGLVLVEKGDVESACERFYMDKNRISWNIPILLTLAIEKKMFDFDFFPKKKHAKKKPESRGA